MIYASFYSFLIFTPNKFVIYITLQANIKTISWEIIISPNVFDSFHVPINTLVFGVNNKNVKFPLILQQTFESNSISNKNMMEYNNLISIIKYFCK